MKKTVLGWMLLVFLLCMNALALAAHDERLPDGVNEILSGRAWDGYEVTQVDGHTAWGGSRDVAAAILSKGERNVLCLFTNASGKWKLVVKREKALYGGNQRVSLNFPDDTLVISYEFDDRIEEYGFAPEGKKKETWKMAWVRVLTDITIDPATANRSAEVVEIKPTGSGRPIGVFMRKQVGPKSRQQRKRRSPA